MVSFWSSSFDGVFGENIRNLAQQNRIHWRLFLTSSTGWNKLFDPATTERKKNHSFWPVLRPPPGEFLIIVILWFFWEKVRNLAQENRMHRRLFLKSSTGWKKLFDPTTAEQTKIHQGNIEEPPMGFLSFFDSWLQRCLNLFLLYINRLRL